MKNILQNNYPFYYFLERLLFRWLVIDDKEQF